MSFLRAFIAIEFPASLQEAIFFQTARLREAVGNHSVRWVAQANLHLTLKFLGDVSQANTQFLNQMLNAEAARCPRFRLTLSGLGAFPDTRRPRVVWVGMQIPQDLRALQHSIESAAARLGYRPEDRPFSPHLTIGRVRQTASPTQQHMLRQTLESMQLGSIGQAEIDSITLMKSDLQPGGSVYTPLFTAKLAVQTNPEVKSESS